MLPMGFKLEEYYKSVGDEEKRLQQRTSNVIAQYAQCLLARYDYTHGSGSEANRSILFIRPGGKDSIQAIIYTLNKDGMLDTLISTVPGHKIYVDIVGTIYKIFYSIFYTSTEDSVLSSFTETEQAKILRTLQPEGSKKVAVVTDNGGSNGFEQVTSLAIYEPNAIVY